MTLRTRIIIVAIGIIIIVSATLIYAGWKIQNESEIRFEQSTVEAKTALWKKIINSQLDKMEAVSSSLARDRDTRNALKKLDYTVLADNAKTSYNLLSTSKIITKLQIADIRGNIVFSAPQAYSGRTSKHLVEDSMHEGMIKRGLQADDDGNIIAVLAFPLTVRGQTVGAGVYGMHLQPAIEDFKRNDQSEVLIYGANGRLLLSTDDSLRSSLNLQLPEIGSRRIDAVEIAGRVFSIVVQPILTPNDEALAHLVSVKDFTESYHNQRQTLITSLVIVFLIIVGAMVGIYWYMNRLFLPLQSAIAVIGSIARGDLTAKIKAVSRDETGQLLSAMDVMLENLHNMVGHITHSTSQLASSAEELSHITESTRSDIDNQRSNTAQVATAVHEMANTVQEVERSATAAADAVTQASENANHGKQIVAKTTRAIEDLTGEIDRAGDVIHRLEKESVKIGSVLDVIRSIAEQTNLLALNAAIEAARAGEQGRGFAVVADEVRTLANRTQQSTQEIRDMIQHLQSGSEQAVQVMDSGHDKAQASLGFAIEANSSLDSIVKSVQTISDMNQQIASAAVEQSAVAEDINENVHKIAQTSEQIAENGTQTATASEQLAQLAVTLKGTVTKFKV